MFWQILTIMPIMYIHVHVCTCLYGRVKYISANFPHSKEIECEKYRVIKTYLENILNGESEARHVK